MTKFSKGDKVLYRPNTKVDPWVCKVLETPPLERSRPEMDQNRYKLKVLEPAEDTVFLEPRKLKEPGYYE